MNQTYLLVSFFIPEEHVRMEYARINAKQMIKQIVYV
jgi:hypothetical protein